MRHSLSLAAPAQSWKRRHFVIPVNGNEVCRGSRLPAPSSRLWHVPAQANLVATWQEYNCFYEIKLRHTYLNTASG